jgi:hypothetical protein
MRLSGPFTTWSRSRISPSLTGVRPWMQRSRVVLPHPDGPTMTSASQSATWRFMSSKAVTPAVSNRLVQCSIEITGGGPVPRVAGAAGSLAVSGRVVPSMAQRTSLSCRTPSSPAAVSPRTAARTASSSIAASTLPTGSASPMSNGWSLPSSTWLAPTRSTR